MKKKVLVVLMIAVLMVTALSACGKKDDAAPADGSAEGEEAEEGGEDAAAEPVDLGVLKIQFVPSRPADEIITTTEGLGDLLIPELAARGYNVSDVEISVSSSFEAAGEALSAGSVDLAYLPSGTYCTYSDEVEAILTATRSGLSNNSTNPADWNGVENKTERSGDPVTFYKGLIYAGPSEKGRELAEKVNNGEALTWEDLNSAVWGISSNVTSNAGYSYPTAWVSANYDGKKLTDLENTIQGNYADCFQKLAAEQIDVTVCYADGRTDYEEDWETPTDQTTSKGAGWGRPASIWEECNVIGVTLDIVNDTISITKAKPEIYNPEFIKAFQESMIALSETEEGKAIIGIYTHDGYVVAHDSDYDDTREFLKQIQE